ncbi:MAG: bifunctional phosphopantothenoylcysteine decarboxylase/phosphopantothenate--cysteine ligase CoaBC [Hydrogenophilus sp.]|nr:bifunctional phosphopantothenoylcysteine decarboxylase/phosphopantothenate--cysteine ligase CoaBC [Hydrogenophilus sp.]
METNASDDNSGYTAGMGTVAGQRIVLAVTGSVAAYKACEVVRRLRERGALVDVVMSRAATRLVSPLTFQALTGRPVWQRWWGGGTASGMEHIELTRGAALMVVAPATADVIARLAQGRADDLVAAAALARTVPLAVVPAMNQAMWENRATQRNVATLIADGVAVWGPGRGAQACGEEGAGRMLEPAEIVARIEAALMPKWFDGRKAVITAGPTFEPLDPVRGITNRSSGRMGFALAAVLAAAGAEVVLVSGPTSLPTPWGVRRVDVVTAQEMYEAVLGSIDGADLFIAVAAVADFRPAQRVETKIKKGTAPLTLTLTPNPDILAEVAALPGGPLCVGFAAETDELDRNAEEKRRRKGVAVVIGNLVNEALGSETTRVVLYDEEGRHPLPAGRKEWVAKEIVRYLHRRFFARGEVRSD